MKVVLFLHVLGSLSIGFYLLLPFVAARLGSLSPAAQAGYAKGLQSLNRIGQWLLVVQFLTGGYLISKFPLSVAWMVVTIVVFVVLGAVTGMLGGPLKRIIHAGGGNKQASASDVSRLSAFSAIGAVAIFVLLLLMYLPQWNVWGAA